MAALVNPSTGLTVDAVGESYDALAKAGFKPLQAEKEPQNANSKPTESSRRRAKRAAATE